MPRVVVRNASHRVVADRNVTAEPRRVVSRQPTSHRISWRDVFEPDALSVSVVVPTTNSPECCVRQCVESLPGDVELVVVLTKRDHPDASWCQHPSARLLQDFEDPFVFARACNKGARAATGDVLLFLNDDCSFRDPADVAQFMKILHDPSVGSATPLATYAGNKDQQAPNGAPTGVVTRTFAPINGFCVALRRSLFWGIGAWDERYRGYGTDDDDLAARIMQHHYRQVIDGNVVVDHVGHHSFGRDWEYVQEQLEIWGEVFREKWGFARSEVPTRFSDPDVSVVIPAYNCEAWLGACLDSVFSQETNARFEVVVVNDGSTDGTKDIVDVYRSVHGYDLISLRQPNRGASAARNRGVRRSLAPIIVFQDADDVMPPGRIEAQVRHLSECDVSYGQLVSFEPGSEPGVGEDMPGIIAPHKDHLFSGNGFRIGTAAARREVFEEWDVWLDERMAAAEDHEWFVHAFARGLRVACSGDVFLWRRRVQGSLRQRADYGPLRAYVAEKHAALGRYIADYDALPPAGKDFAKDL